MPRKGPATPKDRLRRIEGQIKGIEKMLGSEEYSTDKTVIQLQAVISALESLRIELIKKEIKESILKGLEDSIDKLK